MAEFVTKRERTRRLMLLLLCVAVDVVTIALSVYYIKRTNDIQQGEKEAEPVYRVPTQPDRPYLVQQVRGKEIALRTLETAAIDYVENLGWRAVDVGTPDPSTRSAEVARVRNHHDTLAAYLDEWARRLDAKGEFAPWSQSGGTKRHLTLKGLFDELKAREQESLNKSADLSSQIAAARNREAEVYGQIKTEEDKNKNEIEKNDGFLVEYQHLIENLTSQQQQQYDEMRTQEEQLQAKADEFKKKQREHAVEVAQWDARNKELSRRILWIEHHRREAAELKEPDGKILAADLDYQIVHLDLTRADRLFLGTKFQVYSLEKGGVKVEKGEVEVFEVGEKFSRAAITRVIDPENPLRADDRVYNEYYEREAVRHIAIAGHLTGKLSNDEAIRQIRARGDTYQDEVDEKTNYLVVGGEGYEKHPNYDLALLMGVKIILERHLYDYLNVPQ